MMIRPLHRSRLVGAVALLALLLIPLSACEDSDPVAPSGSTITLSANPANLPEGGTVRTTITALLLTSTGLPLMQNQMFFTSDAGSLFQVGSLEAESPIVALTDDNGVARVEFTTAIGTTVRGQSGSAADEVTITVAGVQVVASVELALRSPIAGSVPVGSTVEFQATVRDSEGLFIVGKVVAFRIDPPAGGLLVPAGGFTNQFGVVTFDVETITEDIDVEAQADAVVSNVISITVQ